MSQEARVDGSGNFVVQIHGDGNAVVTGGSELQLSRPGGIYSRIRKDSNTGKANEIDVVRPFTRAIDVVGRREVMASMRGWLHNRLPISVRVLTGGAGIGKTRLALELIEELIPLGWHSGFLTAEELVRFRSGQSLAAWNWNRPTLAVVDYAASCAGELHCWLKELASHPIVDDPAECQQPLRLLLLERYATYGGDLWAAVFGRGQEAAVLEQLVEPAEPVILQPLADVSQRRAVLVQTLEKLGSSLTLPPEGTDRDFDSRLAVMTCGGVPLFLMMAAATAAREGLENALAMSANDLAFGLAERELERVQRIMVGRGAAVGMKPLIRHLTAVATLQQGLTSQAALEAIDREATELGYTLPIGPAIIRDGLAEALPDAAGGVSAVRPDLIGEALLLSVWKRNDVALPAIARAHEIEPVRTMETVIRTCQDYAIHGHRQALDWLAQVQAERAEDIGALIELANVMPTHTVELIEVAVELLEKVEGLIGRVAGSSQDAGKLECWAGTLNNLSNFLSKIDRRQAALHAANKAVGLFRDLVVKRPDSAQPALVISLTTLSSRLSGMGCPEEALDAVWEAVTIQRRLAVAQPEEFRPTLAACLDTLSNRLHEVGRLEEALDAAKEAVAIERELAARMPNGIRSGLSAALSTLSTRFDRMGRWEEALTAIEESVSIKRDLAAIKPDAFLPDLAGYLNNLANSLWGMGRRAEALNTIREAVSVHRRLAATRPEAFRHHLGMSLNNLSHHLSACGDRREALEAAMEAVNLYREVEAAWPNTSQRELAGSLGNLSNRLSEMGLAEEALNAASETETLSRKLAARAPNAFRPILAMSLVTLSNRLWEMKRWEAGLVTAREAAALYRVLAGTRPEAFRLDLAGSLNGLSICLSEMGNLEQALVAIEEAVSIRREMTLIQPDSGRVDLAQSLGNLSICLSKNGRGSEAVSVAKECVASHRELFAAQPDAFRPALVRGLNTLSNCLFRNGIPEEALAASTEALEILSPLFLSLPSAFGHLMSLIVENYKDRCRDMGQEVDDAMLTPIADALQHLWERESLGSET